MLRRRTFIAFTAIAALAVAGGAPAAALAQTTLRFAHTLSPQDTLHKAAERFAELVAEKTGGEVTVTVHPAGELGDDPGILQGIRLGTIDMGLAGNPFYTAFAPELNVMDLPYLFEDAEQVYAVVDGEVGQRLLDRLDEHGMKGLGFWEIGFRNLTNSVRPVHGPGDVAGLKIRTTPNPAHVKAFELLGASPTPMPFTEVYLALQTGTVDGQENPTHHIYANRLHEVQDHLSLSEHAYTSTITSMNRGKWDRLTPEQQQALVEAHREAAEYQRELNRELNDTALKEMKEGGMQVVEDVDKEAFRQAIADEVRQMYVDQHGSELLDAVTSAR